MEETDPIEEDPKGEAAIEAAEVEKDKEEEEKKANEDNHARKRPRGGPALGFCCFM